MTDAWPRSASMPAIPIRSPPTPSHPTSRSVLDGARVRWKLGRVLMRSHHPGEPAMAVKDLLPFRGHPKQREHWSGVEVGQCDRRSSEPRGFAHQVLQRGQADLCPRQRGSAAAIFSWFGAEPLAGRETRST